MRKNKMLSKILTLSIFSIFLFSLIAASTVMAEAGCLKLTKSWDGDDSLAPEMVVVDIYKASNNEVVGIVYLTAQGNWENNFCNLAPGDYYLIERPVSSFDTFYPAGNSFQITSLNDETNPVELEIVNEYAYPNRTFKISIYDVTVVNDIYTVTVTVCADQNGGVDEDLYFNDQKSAVNSIDSEPITLSFKGECQQITFTVDINQIDLNKTYYVGYPPQQWIEIGEPSQFIPVTISKVKDLNFGSFTAAEGTITVDPAGGLTTGNGYDGYHDGNQQPALVEVSWLPFTQYSVDLSNQITISHDSNNIMNVSNFTTNNNLNTLDGSGYDSFNIGATIEVDPALEPGLYSGEFFVTVSFE